MGHWQYTEKAAEAWAYVDRDLDPDITLLQEAVPRVKESGFIGQTLAPPEALSESRTFLWRAIDRKRKWGSGIFTKAMPLRPVVFPNSYSGWVAAGEVLLPSGSLLTAISLHAVIEHGYSITTLHRMLSDLTPILDGKQGKRTIILGGDFNASLQWGDQQPGQSHRILFDRVMNFGLADCLEKFHAGAVRTWRRDGVTKPWQLDYLFMSQDALQHVVSCQVVDDPGMHALNDHNPILAELDI